MNFKIFFIASCFATNVLAVEFRFEDCSDPSLKQSCQYVRAEDQVSCLRSRVQKIKECNSRMDDYEKQLQDWVYKKVQEKGQGVVDPLKIEKVKHLQKMKELEHLLKWHDLNVKSTSQSLVALVKDFTESYRKKEGATLKKLQGLMDETLSTKEYLDLIQTRFELHSLLTDEKNLNQVYLDRSVQNVVELQAIERFLAEKIKDYKDYLKETNMTEEVPKFEKELSIARSIGDYAQQRSSQIEAIGRKISQHITQQIAEKEKLKLQNDKDEDFKVSRHAEREVIFHEEMTQKIRDALLMSERSTFYDYEFLGARYKHIQNLLTMESVCSEENLSVSAHKWMVWACDTYKKHVPTAKKYLNKVYPSTMKNALQTMEWDKPDFKKNEIKKIRDFLNDGNLIRAIESYDDLLKDFSLSGKGDR